VVVLLAATEAAARLRLLPHLAPLSFHALLTNPLFAIGFGCPLVLHLSSWPPRRQLVALALLGLALTPAVGAAAGVLTAVQAVIAFGVASALVLGHQAVTRAGQARTEALLYLLPSLVALIFTLEVAMFLEFISRFHVFTYDGIAYVADQWFGRAISFSVGRRFIDYPLLASICTAIYLAPPPSLIFVYALQVKRKPHPPIDVITLLLLSGGIGYALYFLFPVSGPKFAFAGFPAYAPTVGGLLGTLLPVPPSPRNAVPSLHMASALMAWTWSRPYGRVASGVALVFVAGTFLATMGLGEHYFFDLAVAMPFLVAVQALLVPAIRPRVRLVLVASSTMLYAAWLWLAAWQSPLMLAHRPLPWLLLAGTVVAYAFGERAILASHFVRINDATRP
jgi:hypothetical protein